MKPRVVYRVDPRIKNRKRCEAIENTYFSLALWAVHLSGDRQAIARSLAKHAREMVAAFGVKR